MGSNWGVFDFTRVDQHPVKFQNPEGILIHLDYSYDSNSWLEMSLVRIRP